MSGDEWTEEELEAELKSSEQPKPTLEEVPVDDGRVKLKTIRTVKGKDLLFVSGKTKVVTREKNTPPRKDNKGKIGLRQTMGGNEWLNAKRKKKVVPAVGQLKVFFPNMDWPTKLVISIICYQRGISQADFFREAVMRSVNNHENLFAGYGKAYTQWKQSPLYTGNKVDMRLKAYDIHRPDNFQKYSPGEDLEPPRGDSDE